MSSMSPAKDKIMKAYKWAMANRPKINGYPYLAEALRQASVLRYVYHLPSGQCLFFTKEGNVASQNEVVMKGMVDVPRFDQAAFLKVLRATQNGDTDFPQFLKGSWESGVVSYEADLIGRTVSYFGANGEKYVEEYPAVPVKM